jgi:ribonucleoside-triphosphate reductase
MRERLSDYQEKYGDLYNLEASPAEATAYRLAKHDVERYPNIITAAEKGGTLLYEQFAPASRFTDDIFSALDIQDELQTLYTSEPFFTRFWAKSCPTGRRRRPLSGDSRKLYPAVLHAVSDLFHLQERRYLAGSSMSARAAGRKRRSIPA